MSERCALCIRQQLLRTLNTVKSTPMLIHIIQYQKRKKTRVSQWGRNSVTNYNRHISHLLLFAIGSCHGFQTNQIMDHLMIYFPGLIAPKPKEVKGYCIIITNMTNDATVSICYLHHFNEKLEHDTHLNNRIHFPDAIDHVLNNFFCR